MKAQKQQHLLPSSKKSSEADSWDEFEQAFARHAKESLRQGLEEEKAFFNSEEQDPAR